MTCVNMYQLLEAIGVISKKDGEKSAACGGNYQDDVTLRADDDSEACQDGEDQEENVLEAVSKVHSTGDIYQLLTHYCQLRKVIRTVHSSPQRRQSWLREVRMSLPEELVDTGSTAFMLILDVKTRWSSTYQMLRKWCLLQMYLPLTVPGQALHHREAINTYIYRHEDLVQYRLTEEDWKAIEMVTHWLKSFRSATTQMSATKTPMLSSTHAIFCGVQAEIRDILRQEKGLSPRLIQGLSDAHLKLSEYYYKFDESPFHLWASHKSYLLKYLHTRLKPLLVLDPRISYSALLDEFEGDDDLLPFLEVAKNKLHIYYKTHYANKTAPCPSQSNTSSQTTSTLNHSPQKNFTARFRKPRVPIDELLEFWKLPQEDFDTCNPFQWWLSRRASFPNLYRLACDVLSIPGGFAFSFFLFVAHCPVQLLPWL